MKKATPNLIGAVLGAIIGGLPPETQKYITAEFEDLDSAPISPPVDYTLKRPDQP